MFFFFFSFYVERIIGGRDTTVIKVIIALISVIGSIVGGREGRTMERTKRERY